MEIPDYSDYSFDDFLMDADFRAWVTHPTPETQAFWSGYMAAHPEQQKTVEEAIWAVQHLTIRPHPFPDESRQRIWQVLDQHYDQQRRPEAAVVPLTTTRWGRWRVAASLAGGLVLAGLGWYALRQPATHTIRTAYTETKQITLPDQSVVTLNRNSSLTYRDDWSADAPRAVWVTGEAFFAVHRQAPAGVTQARQPADRFIVHTEQTDVEVLGTQFDVNTRRGKTRVVLNEGKVKLTRQRAGVEESLLMQPGDRVEVEPVRPGFVRQRVDVRQYDAWRNGQLRFDQTSIADILTTLEDTYGWRISLRNPRLGAQTFTATVPAGQPELVLTLLAESFNLHIHRTGGVVTID
ncbi:hypothetical protein GCM10027578_39480 [Spirosoma luteolum]